MDVFEDYGEIGGDEVTSLAEALPIEQARCREILGHAKEIGPPAAFLVWMLEADLSRAESAAASGDCVEMMRALQKLQEYSE